MDGKHKPENESRGRIALDDTTVALKQIQEAFAATNRAVEVNARARQAIAQTMAK